MPIEQHCEKASSDWAGVLCWIQFKGEELSHQLFCHGGEQKDAPSAPTYTYGESMKTNADCEDGGSADKSVDCWRR